MSDLADIIDLQIAVQDKAPDKPSFGVPLIVDYHTAWPDLVREYTSADDLLEDGFTASSPVYLKALDIKSQNPAPARFKVGRLQDPYTQKINIIPTVTDAGFVYKAQAAGTDIEYEVQEGDAVKDIVEALAPLFDAVSGITATDDDTKVEIEADEGKTLPFWVGKGLRMVDVTAAPSDLLDDLAAIADEDDDWYGLVLVPSSKDIISAVAGWIETKRKIYIAQSADWDVIDAGQSSDVASALVSQSYTRTAAIWHAWIAGTENVDAAWLGVQLALDPGSYTAAFKTLAGVSADNLNAGALTALKNKRTSYYARKRGINITYEGRTPSGRFIDVVRFIDWLTVEIETSVFSLLVNNPKIPYTEGGISAIKGAVEAALQRGKRPPNDGLDPDFESIVTVPALADISSTDKANRILPAVQFHDRLSGALHGIQIRGTITV